MTDSKFILTVFYDSYCPLCVAEMKQLKDLDTCRLLRFENIHAEGFADRYPHIDRDAANTILHAQYGDGRMLYGLDVTHQAWAAVGKKRWIALLRWPVLRWFADRAYLFFARNRYAISYWLTGTRRCASCNIDTVANDRAGRTSP